MKFSDAFPSRWLRASDLKGQEVSVVIDSVEQVELDKETKPVLFFKDKQKALVLNVTNGKKLAKAFGDEMSDWAGKGIVLYPEDVQFQGRLVESIRLRPRLQHDFRDDGDGGDIGGGAGAIEDDIPFMY